MTDNIIRLPKLKTKTPKVGVIIQARMTSKRFPGKILENLGGIPILQRVIERAKKIRGDKGEKCQVIVAVPDTDESELALELVTKLGVENFCGSEDNVLDRYYRAAQFFKFDVIVRITADCPLLEPKVSSEVLQLLLWRKLDYCSNCHPVRTFPKGLDTEAFTFDALEAAWISAITNYDKEHVTPWLQRAPIIKANVQQKIDVSYKNWCVDTKEDLLRVEKEIKPVLILRASND